MLVYLSRRFICNGDGAASVEDALRASGVATAIITGTALMGGAAESMFTEAGSGL